MHEMSIALNIVEICEDEVKKAGGQVVNRIELEIGTLSGVIPDAMEFAIQEAVKETVLQQAERKIHLKQAKARCQECDHTFDIDDFVAVCISCGSFKTEVIQGKEIKIKSLVVS